MSKLLNKSHVFFKRNSATILTCVGGIGVIATTITAVKATPKAIRLLDQARENKGDDLTKLETVKIAGPLYIPSIAIGIGTLACIFGANVLNQRSQAALVSAYALIDGTYKDYRKKVDELYGDEAGSQIRAELAKDKYEEEYDKPVELEDDKRLYYDYYSKRYFEARPYDVQNAKYEVNRSLMMDDAVYLNDWYKHIGLPPLDHGYDFGWNTCANMDAYWQTWIDFNNEKVVMEDGLECIIISFAQDPYPDFEDWC